MQDVHLEEMAFVLVFERTRRDFSYDFSGDVNCTGTYSISVDLLSLRLSEHRTR